MQFRPPNQRGDSVEESKQLILSLYAAVCIRDN